MIEEPIVIAGFGRSGTTWLSDIVSKITGGLILFEPFHPCVFPASEKYCYAAKWSDPIEVTDFLDSSFAQTPTNPWLLRNHLSQPLDKVSTSFISYLWKHSSIIGFKTIRGAHFLGSIHEHFSSKTIYIYRHPLAVLCSIRNRQNFWEEFGWKWHEQTFFERTLIDLHFDSSQLKLLTDLLVATKTRAELIVLMWSISLIIGINQTKTSNGYIVSYEDLYLSPYETTSGILKYLKSDSIMIHPSHLFVPSLTTLNTVHTQRGLASLDKTQLDLLFWKNQLSHIEIDHCSYILNQALDIDPEAKKLVINAGYLNT